MALPILNKDHFVKRLERLYSTKCDTVDNCFHQVDYLICINKENEDFILTKQVQLMFWLLKWDLVNTITIFGRKTIYFLCNLRRIIFFKSSLDSETMTRIKNTIGVDIEFLETTEDGNNESVFKKAVDSMKKNMENGKIGLLEPNEGGTSELERLWYQCLNENNWIKEDMSNFAAYLMSVKDQEELELMRKACALSGRVVFVKGTELICKAPNFQNNREEEIINGDIAEDIANGIVHDGLIPRESSHIYALSYYPIIQSGGTYNLTIQSGSEENKYTADVIIISIGVAFDLYCSSITRTLIVTPNPNDEIFNNHAFLLKVQDFIIDSLRDSVKLSKVYEDTINFVSRERQDLVGHLTDNFGSVIGIEVREKAFEIRQNNEAVAEENMTFNVTVGFNSIPDQTKKIIETSPHMYSLWVGDIVKVEKEGPATILFPFHRFDCVYVSNIIAHINNNQGAIHFDFIKSLVPDFPGIV